ncbi:hypothetical protein BH18ACT4_BH18ACT4_08280 [soil metagenome]
MRPDSWRGLRFVELADFSTDASGQGAATYVLPVATLQAPPFGCGYRTDHIDLIDEPGNEVLAAGAINYYVPCPALPARPRSPRRGPAWATPLGRG